MDWNKVFPNECFDTKITSKMLNYFMDGTKETIRQHLEECHKPHSHSVKVGEEWSETRLCIDDDPPTRLSGTMDPDEIQPKACDHKPFWFGSYYGCSKCGATLSSEPKATCPGGKTHTENDKLVCSLCGVVLYDPSRVCEIKLHGSKVQPKAKCECVDDGWITDLMDCWDHAYPKFCCYCGLQLPLGGKEEKP